MPIVTSICKNPEKNHSLWLFEEDDGRIFLSDNFEGLGEGVLEVTVESLEAVLKIVVNKS